MIRIFRSIIGLHAFAVCDSVSDFADYGKMKALKLLDAKLDFIDLFKELDNERILSSSLEKQLEYMVCNMYGSTLKTHQSMSFCIN